MSLWTPSKRCFFILILILAVACGGKGRKKDESGSPGTPPSPSPEETPSKDAKILSVIITSKVYAGYPVLLRLTLEGKGDLRIDWDSPIDEDQNDDLELATDKPVVERTHIFTRLGPVTGGLRFCNSETEENPVCSEGSYTIEIISASHDSDGDGIPDIRDPDADNDGDGILNGDDDDNIPDFEDSDHDSDGDGTPDMTDPDDDNDDGDGNVPSCNHNGICDNGETLRECADDCTLVSVCNNNGTCDAGESPDNCIADCPRTCNNDGICQTWEFSNCVSDCPENAPKITLTLDEDRNSFSWNIEDDQGIDSSRIEVTNCLDSLLWNTEHNHTATGAENCWLDYDGAGPNGRFQAGHVPGDCLQNSLDLDDRLALPNGQYCITATATNSRHVTLKKQDRIIISPTDLDLTDPQIYLVIQDMGHLMFANWRISDSQSGIAEARVEMVNASSGNKPEFLSVYSRDQQSAPCAIDTNRDGVVDFNTQDVTLCLQKYLDLASYGGIGRHRITITATDGAGHTVTKTAEGVVTVNYETDPLPPTILLNADDDNDIFTWAIVSQSETLDPSSGIGIAHATVVLTNGTQEVFRGDYHEDPQIGAVCQVTGVDSGDLSDACVDGTFCTCLGNRGLNVRSYVSGNGVNTLTMTITADGQSVSKTVTVSASEASTRPTVQSVSPLFNLDRRGMVTVTFNKALKASSLTGQVTASPVSAGLIVPVPLTLMASNNRVSFYPATGNAYRYDWRYQGGIGTGVTDTFGNALAAPYRWEFGSAHTPLAGGGQFALYRDGNRIWSWGNNTFGELGRGINNIAEGLSPGLLTTLQVNGNFVSVVAGVRHALALKEDGTVWSWGDNTFGELGRNALPGSLFAATPALIPGLSDIVAIEAGAFHSVAVKKDGTVWAWGDNRTGQTGIFPAGTTPVLPTQVPGLDHVVAMAAGQNHTVALRRIDGNSEVWAWGANDRGQVTDVTNPKQPGRISDVAGDSNALKKIIAISAGGSHTLLLSSNGQIYSFGSNYAGQLGTGDTTDRRAPILVKPRGFTFDHVIAVAAGVNHSLALKDDGTVYAWGDNYYGELGNGQRGINQGSLLPIQVATISNVIAISAGTGFSMALKSNGTVWMWGSNFSGQPNTYPTHVDDAPILGSPISDVCDGSAPILSLTAHLPGIAQILTTDPITGNSPFTLHFGISVKVDSNHDGRIDTGDSYSPYSTLDGRMTGMHVTWKRDATNIGNDTQGIDVSFSAGTYHISSAVQDACGRSTTVSRTVVATQVAPDLPPPAPEPDEGTPPDNSGVTFQWIEPIPIDYSQILNAMLNTLPAPKADWEEFSLGGGAAITSAISDNGTLIFAKKMANNFQVLFRVLDAHNRILPDGTVDPWVLLPWGSTCQAGTNCHINYKNLSSGISPDGNFFTVAAEQENIYVENGTNKIYHAIIYSRFRKNNDRYEMTGTAYINQGLRLGSVYEPQVVYNSNNDLAIAYIQRSQQDLPTRSLPDGVLLGSHDVTRVIKQVIVRLFSGPYNVSIPYIARAVDEYFQGTITRDLASGLHCAAVGANIDCSFNEQTYDNWGWNLSGATNFTYQIDGPNASQINMIENDVPGNIAAVQNGTGTWMGGNVSLTPDFEVEFQLHPHGPTFVYQNAGGITFYYVPQFAAFRKDPSTYLLTHNDGEIAIFILQNSRLTPYRTIHSGFSSPPWQVENGVNKNGDVFTSWIDQGEVKAVFGKIN